MGLMKRVHTELHSGKGRSLARLTPTERAGWNALISGSENVMLTQQALADRQAAKDAPDGALESIATELRYTGTRPTVDGQYLLVDLLTASRRTAVVSEGCRLVRVASYQATPVVEFARDTQRWFLIPPFTPEDLTLVSQLPVS